MKRSYLHVHFLEAYKHPGNETLPKSSRNEAHLEKAFEGVVGLLAEAMNVQGWLRGK